MSVDLYVPVNVNLEELVCNLISCMTEEELIDFIVKIDNNMMSWDFSRGVVMQLMKQLSLENDPYEYKKILKDLKKLQEA